MVYAQTEQQIREYPDFAEALANYDYQWEAFTVKSDDGWYLTLFHLTGVSGERPSQSKENKDKPPVLLCHGAGDDAVNWASVGVLGPSFPLQLVDNGYDVWMNNDRGKFYSNRNERDGDWTLKERWDWSWADMAQSNIPAVIKHVLKETGKPKLTVFGYSQGSAQNFYALAKNQDYYADVVHRFIAVAPCIMPDIGDRSFEEITSVYIDADQKGQVLVADSIPTVPTIDCVRDFADDPDCRYEHGRSTGNYLYYD